MHEPHALSYATCRGLLAGGVVGRVAITTPAGPRIFTVNYSVVDEAILFRTTPGSVLATYACDSPLAFQVDNLDYAQQRGWTVMATGRGQAVGGIRELAHIRAVCEPRPWAAGDREFYVRLAWTELSGRQLGLSWDAKSDLPVLRSM